MKNFTIFFHELSRAVKDKKGPAAPLLIEEYGKDPFLILVSCLLSLRTRDSVTIKVSRDLFKVIKTPQQLLQLPVNRLEQLIHSVGFYYTKAQNLRKIATILIEKYNGKVPSTKKELLSLPGVGLKTTNLVLSEAFDTPAICVDTHVHRISNQVGLVTTMTPEQTEEALRAIVPAAYQRTFSRYMVLLGQSPKSFQTDFINKCKKLLK